MSRRAESMDAVSTGTTSVFRFSREELESHPYYAAQRARKRGWKLWQWLMIVLAIGIWELAPFGGRRIMTGLPLGLQLIAQGLAVYVYQRDLSRLREGGLLRDLCLAGQSPMLTLLAVGRANATSWPAPVNGSCIAAMFAPLVANSRFSAAAPFAIPTATAGERAYTLIAALIFSISVAFIQHRTRQLKISRMEIIRSIGRTRFFQLAAFASYGLLFTTPILPLFAAAWLLGFVILSAGCLSLYTLPSERHLWTVTDAEFEAWVREWCFGGA